MSGTEVTARDIATGEHQQYVIEDNHVVVTDGRAFVSAITAYANGTHVITIKRAATVEEARSTRAKLTRHFGKAALR